MKFQRLKLHGHGPRALAVAGARVWIAGHFSDTVEHLDLKARPLASSGGATHTSGGYGAPSGIISIECTGH